MSQYNLVEIKMGSEVSNYSWLRKESTHGAMWELGTGPGLGRSKSFCRPGRKGRAAMPKLGWPNGFDCKWCPLHHEAIALMVWPANIGPCLRENCKARKQSRFFKISDPKKYICVIHNPLYLAEHVHCDKS